MTLTTQERKDVAAWLMRKHLFPTACLKADITANVAAIDAYVDSIASALNAELTSAYQGAASTGAQKNALLGAICAKRAGILPDVR